MSDIDFDELDRAVNGALGTTPSQPKDELDIPERNDAQPVTPVERTRMDPTSPVASSAPARPAPAARRSSGRFMDIVHPSSDMRSSSPAPAPTPTAQAAPAVISGTEDVQSGSGTSWNEPLESPFLPDAKVEKRPLGGAAAPAETPAPFDFQGLLDEPEEELLEAPEPQERIEEHASEDVIDFEAAQQVSEHTEAVPQNDSIEQLPVQDSISEAPAEEPTGPTSITQQYKEQPSSTIESGPIYDTESYHHAVVKPPKKKPSWLIIVWIVLLVLLGAVAGWAVYTFVLPML